MANLLRDRWSALSLEQKLSITILSVCCVFLFVGGFSQMRSHVRHPFLVSRQDLVKSIALRTQTDQSDLKTMQELKLKDTDHDGISDYDEIYVYKTSPYLGDSDSDGLSDAEEIAKNSDPNCPQGKNCIDAQATVPQTSTTTTEGLLGASIAPPTPQPAQPIAGSIEEFIANPPLPGSMTAKETREYLRSHGLVTDTQLTQLPDEGILQAYQLSYQEALRIQAGRTTTSSSTSATNVDTSPLPLSSTP